jgi:hypothetical protein
MKVLVISSLLLLSFNSFSMHNKDHKKEHAEMKAKWESMSFEDAKKMKTEKLTQRKVDLEAELVCVNAAADKEGLKACRKERPHFKKK